MYKIVVVDLDGTMLNSDGIVTKETKKAIKKTIEKGIEVIIASGRPIDSIKEIAKEIKSDKYFIAGNGALIYDNQKKEKIYEKYLSKKKVLEIVKLCEENNIAYNVYTQKTILTTSLEYNVLYYFKENLKRDKKQKTDITIINNMYEYVTNMEDERYLKITVCDKSTSVFKSIIKKLRQIKNIEVLDVLHTSKKVIKQGSEDIEIEYYYTEISNENVNKWEAVKYLINKLGIKQEEVIAIGDNINDKMMIENAGLRGCYEWKYTSCYQSC